MLSILINLIAVICGLSVFVKKQKRYLAVVISYFLLTDWFGLFHLITGGDSLIKSIDFFLLYMIIILGQSVSKGEINIKKDKYARLLFWFTLFHLGIFLMTVFLGFETLRFAVQDSRALFVYLIYFPLKRMSNDDIIKAFKAIFVIEVVIGINYLLQFAGIFILKTYDSLHLDGGMVRYTNVAPWFLFYLIIFVITKQQIRYKYLILFFLSLMLILPMSRMRIFLFCLVILYYFLFIKKDYKKIMKVFVSFILIALLFSDFLLARVLSNDNNDVSMIDDIENAVEGKYKEYDPEDSGTLGFRLAMLFERVRFMYDNPNYALCGVGFRHEESPKCYKNFYFTIGTYSESLPNLKEEIHSVDINWVRILMQMGYIGVIIYIFFMCNLINILYKNKNDIICAAGFLYILLFSLGSLTEAVWTENHVFKLLISLLMVYCYNLNRSKNFNKEL